MRQVDEPRKEVRVVGTTKLWATIGGVPRATADRARVEALGGSYVPLHPSTDPTFKPVVIKAPPTMPADMAPHERAEVLARAYSETVWLKHGFRYRWLPSLPESKHHGRLLDAGAVMEAEGVAPAAWVLFSFRAWAVPGKIAPPHWVFSTKRLVTRRAWYEDTRDLWTTRSYYLDSQRLLVAQWDQMWRLLVRADLRTRMDVVRVVDRIFPGDTYERALVGCAADRRRVQETLNKELEAGAIAWT